MPAARPLVVAFGGGGAIGAAAVFRLCGECAKRDVVQEQLRWHGMEVDAIGEHGKALFRRQFHTPLFGHAEGFKK